MNLRILRNQAKKYLKLNEYDPKKPYLLIPGMVSRSERKNLFKQSSQLTHKGHVLEFGAFFGASTSAILHGMKASGSHREFHVFDYFKTNDNWFADITRRLAGPYQHLLTVDADGWLDFSKVYEHFINDSIVHTHKILISDLVWKKEPVELIHLDLPKDWSQARKIASETFPYLIRDAKLIFQDFVNQWSYELSAMIGFLLREDLIRLQGSFGSTLSTSVTQDFAPEVVQALSQEMSDKAKVLANFDHAFQASQAFLNPEEQIILRVGRSVLLSESDHKEGLRELSKVMNHMNAIDGRGGKAFQNALEFGMQSKKSIS